MLSKKIFLVNELNTYIKDLLEDDGQLNNMWIKGEISNYKAHSSGHIYLILKDAVSSVRGVMFRSRAKNLVFSPENGMKVLVRGYVSVYERDGQYQVYIEEMQPEGVGALHLAFEQLKARLEKEGLFDEIRKRELPLLPQTIGVVTSSTGAAWQDIQKVIFERYPNAHLILAPVLVQGDSAPEEIARGINLLNSSQDIDVIIVGRGGGSLEELWAFNTETVARAIFASKIPVISAVGHQTDFTIADFVADKRAATPSAAAEMVVPVKKELEKLINIFRDKLKKATFYHLSSMRQQLEYLSSSVVFKNPERLLQQKLQHLDTLRESLERNAKLYMKDKRHNFHLLAGKLDTLSPLTTLARGYAICYQGDNKKVITSTSQVAIGDNVEVKLAHGRICCEIKKRWEENSIHDKK